MLYPTRNKGRRVEVTPTLSVRAPLTSDVLICRLESFPNKSSLNATVFVPGFKARCRPFIVFFFFSRWKQMTSIKMRFTENPLIPSHKGSLEVGVGGRSAGPRGGRCGERGRKKSTCDGCDGRCRGKRCHRRSPSPPVEESQVHGFDWPYRGGAVCHSAALISTSMKMYVLCSKKTGGVTTCQEIHKQGYLEHGELYILKSNIHHHLVSFPRWGLAKTPLVPHLAAPLQKGPQIRGHRTSSKKDSYGRRRCLSAPQQRLPGRCRE